MDTEVTRKDDRNNGWQKNSGPDARIFSEWEWVPVKSAQVSEKKGPWFVKPWGKLQKSWNFGSRKGKKRLRSSRVEVKRVLSYLFSCKKKIIALRGWSCFGLHLCIGIAHFLVPHFIALPRYCAFYKYVEQKQTHRCREQTTSYQWEEGLERGKIRLGD